MSQASKIIKLLVYLIQTLDNFDFYLVIPLPCLA